MDRRPARTASDAAQHRGALGLLLGAPLAVALRVHALTLACLLLPQRMAVTSLRLFNAASGDVLAYLTGQPTPKTQVRRRRGGERGAASCSRTLAALARHCGCRPPTRTHPRPHPTRHFHAPSWSGSGRRSPRRSSG